MNITEGINLAQQHQQFNMTEIGLACMFHHSLEYTPARECRMNSSGSITHDSLAAISAART